MEFNDFHNVDLIMLIRLTYKGNGICVVMLQKMICWRNNFAGVCLRFESWQYFIVPSTQMQAPLFIQSSPNNAKV